MKALVVLAVMGVCSASYQAYNPGYGPYGGSYGYVQPKWTGPVAATVPAGVGGKIIPVSDTYEVAAARNAFFGAYQDQLATIRAHRYGTPGYGRPGPVAPGHYGAPTHSSGAPAPSYGAPAPSYGAPAPSYGAPAPSYGAPAPSYGAPTQVGDTPEVAAAKTEFFRLYNQQAAAAAAAPDHYTYH